MGGRGASSGAKGGAGRGKFEAYRAEQQERANKWLDEKPSGYSALKLTDEYGGVQTFETYDKKGIKTLIADSTDPKTGELYDPETVMTVEYSDGSRIDAGWGLDAQHAGNNDLVLTLPDGSKKNASKIKTTGIVGLYSANSATEVVYGTMAKAAKFEYRDDMWRLEL